MTITKAFTAKKSREVVIIDGEFVVKSADGFNVYDHCNTYSVPADKDFDETPFIAYYNEWKAKMAKEAADRKEAERLAEIQRVDDLKQRIAKCETPRELAEEFGFTIVETGSHWSDLYEGRSRNAIIINSRADYEVMDLAIEIHGAEGQYGEVCRRDGEHHSTFSSHYDLDSYQDAVKDHFCGNNFFYKSQESEAEFFLEKVKEAETMEDAAGIVKAWQEIEDGYYDCNGNLEILSSDLDSPHMTGYSYDVYSYSFCYRLNEKSAWKAEEEIEE